MIFGIQRQTITQALVLLVVAAVVIYFINNAATNLNALGLAHGFGFLNHPAGFDISFSLIDYDRNSSSFGRVLAVGMLNTIAVAVLGIIAATILGFAVGVLQLSGNWPLTKLCRTYIEFTRNIPLLLQLLFWYTVVLTSLPSQRASLTVADAAFLNVRGLYLPKPLPADGFTLWLVANFVVVVGWIVMARRSRRRRDETGEGFAVAPVAIALLIAIQILLPFIAGTPLTFEIPQLKGFNFVGGLTLPPEFCALLLGLSVYSGAFIAEIVRSGILSVQKGQKEAAHALGLSPRQTLWLVVVPQAMRVVVPPLTSQFLNLTKNSSLAIAIGYPDIVSVFAGTTLNQTGQAIEVIAITMAFYLVINLITSLFMNWYNASVALVGKKSR